MNFKNVKLDDYCFNLELHKSMFFIDMLEDTYEFTLKGDEIEIFKKIKNGISEPITRKELIYSIQVEMAEKYGYRYIKEKARCNNLSCLSEVEKLIATLYNQFPSVDSIHKAIDNMVYLEKRLKRQTLIVPEQPPKKVIVASAPPKNPEFGGWEEDEESSDEESTDEEESIDEKESRLNDKFNKMGWHGLHHPRGKFEDCGCTSCMNDPSSYHKSAHTRKLVDELKGEFDSLPYGRVKWEKLLKFQGPSDEEEEDEEEEEEKVSEKELKMESLRLKRKQMESADGPVARVLTRVLKNALEKECLSARTELFRPAWTPPR